MLSDKTPVLDAPVHGQDIPVADIIAAATGSDGDFVVKRIDVYPASYPGTPAPGGYLLPIAMDMFRGRYRDSFSTPCAFPANVPQRYRSCHDGIDPALRRSRDRDLPVVTLNPQSQ